MKFACCVMIFILVGLFFITYFLKYTRNTAIKEDSHKNELPNIPGSIVTTENTTRNSIPNVIHKVLITHSKKHDDIPNNIQEAHDSWRKLNPGYELRFYDGETCEKYIEEHFGKEHIDCYNNIAAYSGKCDFFRYCVLYNEGGWYTDWKMVCLKPLDEIKKPGVKWYSFNDNVAEIFLNFTDNNMQTAFLGSVKGHPILKDAIESVMYNTKHKVYGNNVLDATATGLLGRSFQKVLPMLNQNELLIGDFNQSNYRGHTYEGAPAKLNVFYINKEEVALHKCKTCVQDQVWDNGNNYWIMWYDKTYFV